MTIRIDIRPADDFHEELQATFRRWRTEAFGDDTQYTWAVPDLRLLVWDGDVPVSTLKLFRRQIRVGEQSIWVGGIGGVMTPSEHRGRGYAGAAMRAAVDYIRENMQVAFGHLICRPMRLSFYAGLGWQQVPGPMYFDQPDGKTTWRDPENDATEVMVMPLDGQAWPEGRLDLETLPW